MAGYEYPEDPGDGVKVVSSNCDGKQREGPGGHKFKERVFGREIDLIDITVAVGVLKRHKASGDVGDYYEVHVSL